MEMTDAMTEERQALQERCTTNNFTITTDDKPLVIDEESVPIPPPIPRKELVQQESSICSLETPFDPLAADVTSSSLLSQTVQIPETIIRHPVLNGRRRAAAKVRSALPPSPQSQKQQQQTADQSLPVPAFACER
ncbi:unnamed protein product [Rotaria sordida]|uniref:Uncharacterized protein n=1 Tax=Rotaria sordida TaxID=392033 RepID=A0A815HBB0_9BILA|nr:unnamed protein product [Rotaria sordida]